MNIIEEDIETIKKNIFDFADKIRDKIFLVTGGAGFIGSWFCDVIDQFGAKIICLDNFVTGSQKNIFRSEGKKNFTLIEEDVCTFFTEEKIDYIVHMASVATPKVYQEQPISVIDTNVLGTKNMLELAKKKNVKGFLFTSTSEIYGEPPHNFLPTPETYYGFINTLGARAMYNEAKRAAETYCYFYYKKYGLPIRIARVFNTYGARLDLKLSPAYGRVVINFIRQALDKQPLTIYGDGRQTRSFCYITDQITGLIKLLLTPGIDGEVVNIGDNQEITIADLANVIIKLTNAEAKFKYSALPQDDPLRRYPDLSKAKKLLDYLPQVSLETGLIRTINWVKYGKNSNN